MRPCSTISGAAPSGEGEHRRAAGEGFDHHQPERLGPADRVDQRLGTGEQVELVAAADLADVDGIRPEQRLDALGEVAALGRLPHLGRQQDPPPGRPGDGDRAVGALVGMHPPEEQDVPSVAPARTGSASTSMPWWITAATGTSGALRRWASEIATTLTRSAAAAYSSRSSGVNGPWAVVTTGTPGGGNSAQRRTGERVVVDHVDAGQARDRPARHGRARRHCRRPCPARWGSASGAPPGTWSPRS